MESVDIFGNFCPSIPKCLASEIEAGFDRNLCRNNFFRIALKFLWIINGRTSFFSARMVDGHILFFKYDFFEEKNGLFQTFLYFLRYILFYKLFNTMPWNSILNFRVTLRGIDRALGLNLNSFSAEATDWPHSNRLVSIIATENII